MGMLKKKNEEKENVVISSTPSSSPVKKSTNKSKVFRNSSPVKKIQSKPDFNESILQTDLNDSQSEYDNFDIIDNIEPEQFSYNPSFKTGSTRESLSQIKLPLPSKLQNLKNKKRRYLSSATSIASTSSNLESLYNKHNSRGLNSSLLYRNNRNNSLNLENS